MDNENDKMYLDGTVAQEIEHLLLLRLHDFNTVKEVELMKIKIHAMMEDMFHKGELRQRDSQMVKEG